MAVGTSGRILADIDPELKQAFYKALKARGKDFKEWLKEEAEIFIKESGIRVGVKKD